MPAMAWVVLAAAGLMVLLALSMFGLFNIQLPSALQSYFQNQSNKLSGGKVASVFVMGMLSALIVGPCVAPPLAFALGYIGKTGDALLGGAALYAMALGTGVPLMLIGTFGGHILPRAGDWMNGIKYAFGVILLAVAVYLATPFLPYGVVAGLYTALLLAPALYLFYCASKFSGSLKKVALGLGAVLLAMGAWFGGQSVRGQTTPMHEFLTLHQPASHAVHGLPALPSWNRQFRLPLPPTRANLCCWIFMPIGACRARKWRRKPLARRRCKRRCRWRGYFKLTLPPIRPSIRRC